MNENSHFAGLILTSTEQNPVAPLSTATPAPGTVQINGHANLTGGPTGCFRVGERGSLTFGGNHDYGLDLLLRLKLKMPEGLTATYSRTGKTVTGMWSKDFSLAHIDPRSTSSGSVTLMLGSEMPGRYEIVLQSEWLELESMEPIDAPNQSETRTFTYFVLVR